MSSIMLNHNDLAARLAGNLDRPYQMKQYRSMPNIVIYFKGRDFDSIPLDSRVGTYYRRG